MRPRVYFDNASTTAVHPEVLETYKKLLDTDYVNSESLYEEGTRIHDRMEKARAAIAGLLACRAKEILFTGGASESNSMAIKGVALAVPEKNTSSPPALNTAVFFMPAVRWSAFSAMTSPIFR